MAWYHEMIQFYPILCIVRSEMCHCYAKWWFKSFIFAAHFSISRSLSIVWWFLNCMYSDESNILATKLHCIAFMSHSFLWMENNQLVIQHKWLLIFIEIYIWIFVNSGLVFRFLFGWVTSDAVIAQKLQHMFRFPSMLKNDFKANQKQTKYT